MPDPVTHDEKTKWFAELLKVQEEIAAQRCQKMVGTVERVLVEERNEKSGLLSGRTGSSVIVEFPGGDELLGEYADVQVTSARSWMLQGELVSNS